MAIKHINTQHVHRHGASAARDLRISDRRRASLPNLGPRTSDLEPKGQSGETNFFSEQTNFFFPRCFCVFPSLHGC